MRFILASLFLTTLVVISEANPLKDILQLTYICPNTDCQTIPETLKLKELYPNLNLIVDESGSSGMYTLWSESMRRNEGELLDYANLRAIPYGLQITEERIAQLAYFDYPIKIAVINGSSSEQRSFFTNFLELSRYEPYVAYIELSTQFNLAFSLEVYRRHCPTIIAYNPASKDLWLSYMKFTGNNTIDTPNIKNLLAELNNGEVKSIKLGWINLYTKFLSLSYIYNNFHYMFNYLLGGVSIISILILLIFEKPLFKLIQSLKPSPVPVTQDDHSKKNK